MQYFLALTFLALLLTPSQARRNVKEDKEVETVNIITPLPALPSAAASSLLPLLRRITPSLPTAPIVNAASEPLPGVLSATAPLVVNRASTTFSSAQLAAAPSVRASQPIVTAPAAGIVPTAKLLVASTVPAAPPVVPGPSFITTPTFYSSVSSVLPTARLTATVPVGVGSYSTSPIVLNYASHFSQFRSLPTIATVQHVV